MVFFLLMHWRCVQRIANNGSHSLRSSVECWVSATCNVLFNLLHQHILALILHTKLLRVMLLMDRHILLAAMHPFNSGARAPSIRCEWCALDRHAFSFCFIIFRSIRFVILVCVSFIKQKEPYTFADMIAMRYYMTRLLSYLTFAHLNVFAKLLFFFWECVSNRECSHISLWNFIYFFPCPHNWMFVTSSCLTDGYAPPWMLHVSEKKNKASESDGAFFFLRVAMSHAATQRQWQILLYMFGWFGLVVCSFHN